MIIGMSFTKFFFFYADRKSKMAANILKGLQMIIPGQFGFNCLSGLKEEAL
jgi:hypothetical protein